jgi:hypothetical protein
LEPSYSALSRIAATAGLNKPAVSEALIDCVGKSLELLAKAPRATLVSNVPAKEYFVLTNSSPGEHRAASMKPCFYTTLTEYSIH